MKMAAQMYKPQIVFILIDVHINPTFVPGAFGLHLLKFLWPLSNNLCNCHHFSSCGIALNNIVLLFDYFYAISGPIIDKTIGWEFQNILRK